MSTTLVGVGKRYRRSGPAALDDVDFELLAGTTTVVMGSNGSGKSTLLRVVTGITRPTSGRVSGRPATIGYAPERLAGNLRMTARTYLLHMGRIRGLPTDTAMVRAEELVRHFNLQPGPDVPVRTLSKGNNQKVALAQAFLAPVGLLALDEPTNGLDEQAQARLWAMVERRRREGSAVIVTALNEAPTVGFDHAFRLAAGRPVPVTRDRGVRIEIDGAGVATVGAQPGVIKASDDGRVVFVAADRADAVLLWALQHECSVVSVRPVEGERW